MPHQIDLTKYADRIGLSEDFKPDFATLAAIQNAHTCSIPFENFSVLLGHPVKLEPEALEGKLVTERRGGYCFEQNGLMLEVLLQIGFNARPHAGRVRMGAERDFLPPRTHLFIQVDLDGRTWIVDSGVGGMSLTSPILFELDQVQTTLHESRRIVKDNGVYFHQAVMGEDWIDVYEFSGEQMPMIDRQVSNWWTSTNPNAKFSQNMMAGIGRANGERVGLLNGVLTHRKGAEIIRKVDIRSDEHLLEVLAEEFGLIFPPDTTFGNVGCPWRHG